MRSPFFFQSKVKGFTLIELIIVIVVLSIVAAVAIPRFVDFSDKAQLNSARYIASSLQAGVESVKQIFIVQGYTTRVQNLSGFGDGTIDTNNTGYPIGIDKGNGNENIGRGNAGCVGVWQGVLELPPSVATNASADYQSYRHTSSRVCSYVFRGDGDTANRNNAQLIIRYDSRDGTVDVCGRRSDIPNC